MSQMNEDRELEELLSKLSGRIGSPHIRKLLFEVGLVTAAASRLEYLEEHHQCLVALSKTLDVDYSKDHLTNRIKMLIA